MASTHVNCHHFKTITSVGTVTRLWAEQFNLSSWQEQEILSFLQNGESSSGIHPLSYSTHTRGPLAKGKLKGT